MSFGFGINPIGGLGLLGAGASGLQSNKPRKLDRLTSQQQGLQDQLLAGLQGEGPFANLFQFDPQQTAQFFDEAVGVPLRQQFNEETVPQITGQFRGAGLGQSSFAGQALGRASEGLERQLSSALAQQQFGQLDKTRQNLFEGINSILNRQQFDFEKPQESGFEKIISQTLPLLAAAI